MKKYFLFVPVAFIVIAALFYFTVPPTVQGLTLDQINQIKIKISDLLAQVKILQTRLVQLTGSSALSSQTKSYDIVVVGSGTGGSAAAIQAARMGMKVALLEETDWVGGQMTAAAVSMMDGGIYGGSGIYKEFINKVNSYYTARGKTKSDCYNGYSICFEPSVGQSILRQMLADASNSVPGKSSLDLYTQTTVVSVNKLGNSVTGVVDSNRNVFNAKVVIDATEYGDVIPLTGASYRIGNGTNTNPSPNACVQDITYVTVMKKYPNGVPQGLFMATPPGPSTGPQSYNQIKSSFAQVVSATGSPIFVQYPENFSIHNFYRRMPDSSNSYDYPPSEPQNITKTGVNWANDYPTLTPYIYYDPSVKLSTNYIENKSYRSQVNCEAKLKTLQFIYYVQHDLGQPLWSVANDEGFDTAYNTQQNSCSNIGSEYKSLEKYMAVMPYVREGRRIIGETTVTAKDIKRTKQLGSITMSAKDYPNSIAAGDYPDDLHNCNTDIDLESSLGETRNDIPNPNISGPFSIPIEALIPESVDGFLAAEKNISVSRLAEGATRLQPVTMSTGQAAGALASLAVKNNIQPRKVDPASVQIALVQNNLIISPYVYSDVSSSDAFAKAVQFVSARNFMIGYGNGKFGLNDNIIRRDAAVAIVKAAGLALNPPSVPTFTDVPLSDPAYKFIEALYKSGATVGCSVSPKKYCPDDLVTRQQFAILFSKALNINTQGVSQTPYFSDVPSSLPGFAWIQNWFEKGITAGCSASPRKFCPDSYATRGQVAQFITNVLSSQSSGTGNVAQSPVTQPPVIQPPVPVPAGSIIITSPSVNSVWYVGSSYTINWTGGDANQGVAISFVPSPPACTSVTPSCATVQASPYVISAKTLGNGSYLWTIPKSFPSTYLGKGQIKINSGNLTGLSNLFTISVSPSTGSY